MGIILDIVIIAIIALSIFLGYRKGLVKIAVKLCAFLIAIIVSIVFYKPVSNIIINNTQLDEKIESAIIENGSIKIEEDEETQNYAQEQEEEQNNESFLENVQQILKNVVKTATQQRFAQHSTGTVDKTHNLNVIANKEEKLLFV